MATTPRKRRLFALVTLSGAFVLALLLVEVGLRVGGYTPVYVNPLKSFHTSDPDLGYRGRPGFVGRFKRPSFDVVVAHDGDGFRRQERQHPEAECAYRLFCYGDSYTWGWGVAQGEVWTDRLSDLLPDAHVVNRGANACGTVYQWTRWRRDEAARTRPGDIVLVLFCDNDFGDNVTDEESEPRCAVRGSEVTLLTPTARFERGLKDGLKDASYLFNLCDFGVNALKRRLKVEREAKQAEAVAATADDPRRLATRWALACFAADVRAKGARFVVARIPAPGDIAEGASPAPAGFRAALEEICRDERIDAIDLVDPMRSRPGAPSSRLFFATDLHWTPEGHAVAATALAPRIREIRSRP